MSRQHEAIGTGEQRRHEYRVRVVRNPPLGGGYQDDAEKEKKKPKMKTNKSDKDEISAVV